MKDHLDPMEKLSKFSTPRSYINDLPWIIGMAAVLFLLIEVTV
jgi:hypothetical protein